MSMNQSKLNIATAFTILASLVLLLAFPDPTSADNQCHSDQKQTLHQGAILFGAKTALGQTFIPGVPGQRVCRVKVMISKNIPGADNLTLRLMRSNFAPLDAAVTIPGGPIPMGTSLQLFDFGCNGAPLGGMPFYGLRLESPNSPPGAYSWQGVAGNPYVKPGDGGRGWRNPNSAPSNWNSLGGWDFAFEIYMCD